MKYAKYALSLAFVGLAVFANWLASKYVVRVPLTPYLAPAGFYAIGICLVFRDWLQQIAGLWWTLMLVAVAAVSSYLIGDAAGWTSLQTIAVASLIAFVVSEAIEAGVFTPLRKRNLTAGVLASGTVGGAIDSFLFIWLAWSAIKFPGATHHELFLGNFLGKFEMILVGGGLTALRRYALPVVAKP